MKFKFPAIHIPGPVKTMIKLAISVAILVLIIRKVDERILLNVVREANPLWVMWALIWFIFSKVIAAFRFNVLLKTEDIHLTHLQNLRLYWLCMYYNLLLPGGISGDGYKIKVLMEQFNRPLKRIVAVTLMDRISGLIALVEISLILLLWVPVTQPYWMWVIPALVVSCFVGWGLFRWGGGKLRSAWVKPLYNQLVYRDLRLLPHWDW